ncbi:MAG: glycosyltransferase family 39 protein [Anaerolineae bacterium]|nr:glycosyltransferase family 39 protein [Anaerolineae bacterium]
MRKLLIVLLLFFITLRFYQWALPTYEGPDETEHVAYVLWIRDTGTLPDPQTDQETLIRQQITQNPLYYVTAALLSRLLPIGDFEFDPPVNPWRTYPTRRDLPDNRNNFLIYHGHIITPTLQNQINDVFYLRLISSLFGIITLTGVYIAGMILFKREQTWALLAVIFVAFTPQILQAFATVTNDAAVIAFGTWSITAALYLYQHPERRWAAIFAGAMMGWAAISKTNGLIVAVAPALALLLTLWKQRSGDGLKRFLSQGAILLTVAFLCGGWWYVRAFLLYGDPLGISTHQQTEWAARTAPSLTALLFSLPTIIISIWADFGWYKIIPDNWGYFMPLLALFTSFLGWRKLRWTGELVLLFCMALLGLVALIAWAWVSAYVPGRLYLPFYPAVMLLIVSGFRRLPNINPFWVWGFVSTAFMMIPLTLYPAFGIPKLHEAPPIPLIGTPLNFGEIRFLGYQIDSDRIAFNQARLVTLCWQAPSSNAPIPVPYAFSLQVIGENDQRIAARDSYPGLGTYTLWQPDKIFCDRFLYYFETPIPSAQVFPLILKLYNPETGEELVSVDSTGSPTNIIGYVRTSGTISAAPTEYQAKFGDLILQVYQLTNRSLTLTWYVTQPITPTLKTFVHLIDQEGSILAQVDVITGGERYPSWAWNTGETITETLTLPILPTDNPILLLGLYDQESLIRLPIDDQLYPDRALRLKIEVQNTP